MKRIALLLAVVIFATPAHGLDFSKLSKLFNPPKKKKAVKQTRKKSSLKKHSKSVPSVPSTEVKYKGYFVVDTEWMARYRILEKIWDYEIPEDKDIKFEAGKYLVPPVVFRHYEDMAKTEKPTVNNNLQME